MSYLEQIFTDEDHHVVWLRIVGIVVALILVVPFIFHQPGTRRKRLYRRYIIRSGRFYNRHCAPQIASFLGEIRQACLVSGPKLTVIEIGPGPFPSLQAYPAGTKLICIEPCNEFNKFIEHDWKRSHLASKRESEEELGNAAKNGMSSSSSCSSLSGAEMTSDQEGEEKDGQLLIYNVGAERMAEVVGSNSADIVVARQLLCSIDDVPKVLEQINIVLKPGGQYFFWEHVRSQSRFFQIFQKLLAYPPLSYLTGCDPVRPNYFAENVPGFSRFELKNFSAPLPWYQFPYFQTVSGCAVK